MTRILVLLFTGSVVFAGCLPVAGNRILGRDLAAADSRFAAVPATTTVGFAPAPGARRVYSPADLKRIARANGMPVGDFSPFCFELPMKRLTEGEVLAAMQRSLADALLTIVELPSGRDVPAGPVEFPVEGIEPAPPSGDGARLWRGYVKYAETRRFPVWARVRIAVQWTAVVTDRDLPPDAPISLSALRIETRTEPFDRVVPATRIEQVAGCVPRRALKAGSVIPLNALTPASDVRRGDFVPVVVESGMARVRFEAIAESNARDGDIVELRNPANGKVFRARLDPGPGARVVIAGGGKL